MAGSTGYRVRVRVRDRLSSAWWTGTFSGLTVDAEADGTTLVSGELPDQAALHGLLAAIRDLGLSLVSVETEATPRSASASAADDHERSDGAPEGRGGSR